MISSNTRATRSRYSSPANQQRNGNGETGSGANRGSNKDGERAFMKRWLEPPVQSKASFEDAGLRRFGVLENMAPLGSLPKAKKNEGGTGTGTGVRKIILRPSGSGAAAAAAAAASTGVSAPDTTSSTAAGPETPNLPTTATAENSSASTPSDTSAPLPANTERALASQPTSPTQQASRHPQRKLSSAANTMTVSPTAPAITPVKGQVEEDDEDYDPKRSSPRRRHSGKPAPPKKGRPPASVRRSSLVAPKASSPEALQQSPIMSTPSVPPTPRAMNPTEKVIELAIEEALHHYRYPTAYALRTMWDENSGDTSFVRMLQQVFTQTADDETTRTFSEMMEKAKRHGKKGETGFIYFEQPRSGSLPRKQKALAAPYSDLLQLPAARIPEEHEQGRGETRPTKKIKIVHSGARDRTSRDDATGAASALSAPGSSAGEVSGLATAMDTSADTCADASAEPGSGAGVKTPSSRKRGRRQSATSESSLSSAMSLSSPEMTHHRRNENTREDLASPSANRGARVKKAAAAAAAKAKDPIFRPQPLAAQALESNGSAPNSRPIISPRRPSLASDKGKDEQRLIQDRDQPVPAQSLDERARVLDGELQPSSPSPMPMHGNNTTMHAQSHHNHAHENSVSNNTAPPATSFLAITTNENLDSRPLSSSPPPSPTTAVVEERQRHRQQGKIRAAANKKEHQTRAAASKASSPSTAAAASAKDAIVETVASMPGLITSLDLPPVPAKSSKKSPAATAAATPNLEEAQETATRRSEAKKTTNGYTAVESSIRDASLPPSLSRECDVTPMRTTSGPVSTSTRRATRQSAAAVPPVSTRSTRSARKRSGTQDEPDGTASPSVFSFQGGDGSSATGSRAVTPTNLRPAKKQKPGLRVKLSPVKKKGGTAAGVPRSMGEAQSAATNGAAKDQTENDEICSACGNAGDVVCCDGCPRSFHFECVGMDQTEDLPDEWYCNACVVNRFPTRVPIHRGVFAGLLNNLEKSIPRSFSLPKKVQNRFEGVKAGADGDYEDANAAKAAAKKRNNGYEEAPDFFKQRDEGEAVLCHNCQKPAASDRAIIPCSICSFYWHLDCLDPPLSIPPVLKTWRCPAHAEDVLLTAPPLAPAHRFRKIKGADTISPALSRGLKNNGHIEIDWTEDIATKTEDDNSGWRDYASFGRTYKIPARGVVLDFIEQMRKKGHGYGTPQQKPSRTEPYLTPPVEDREKSVPPVATQPTAERSVEELQAALILTGLKQMPTDGVEQLTSALLTSADQSIISLIAQGNADSIARKRLAETDRQSLRALLAQMDAVSANIRSILSDQEQLATDRDHSTGSSSKDADAMDTDPLVTEPTPPSTIDHAEGAMDFD